MKVCQIAVLFAVVGSVAGSAKPFGFEPNQPIQPSKQAQPKPSVYTPKPIQQPVLTAKPKKSVIFANPIEQPVLVTKPLQMQTIMQVGPVASPRIESKSAASPVILNGSRYDPNSINNPFGAGSPYKQDGIMNPFSKNGSPYSNQSATNPFATEAPILFDANGKYLGKLSANQHDPESTSNPFGTYGNPNSAKSINNKFGAGNPFSTTPIYVIPKDDPPVKRQP